ncbi:MAG: hypothetical protein AAF998_15630 [Bacteroidota bacterium]
MTTFENGQVSTSTNFSRIFASLALFVLLIAPPALRAAQPDTLKNARPNPAFSALSFSTFTAEVTLSCPAGSATVTTLDLFLGQPGCDGFASSTDFGPSGTELHFSLNGPHSTLPSNAEIALITVEDDGCGEVHTYQITTDGAGTMLILDEI